MDTEVENRILEFFEGFEFEKGPVSMELMSEEITLQQYLKVYRYILRRRNRINFLKAGNILISLTLVFAHKLDNFHEGVRKFLTSLQKIVHLPTTPVSDLPVPKRFSTKRRLDKENGFDVFDDLCPLESINKRINDKILKDDNSGYKMVRANRAPCFKIQLKDKHVPSPVYNSQFEIIAEKRDLKIWGYLCERPVPQSHVCYPCTHNVDDAHTAVDDFNQSVIETYCPSAIMDRSESSMSPSHFDESIFTKASEDDEMSLMNTTIRSDAEMEEPSTLVVCELGQTDVLEDEGRRPFFNWLQKFAKHITPELPNEAVHDIINGNTRSTHWPLCTEQTYKLESDLRFLKTSLENRESINEEELLDIFKPFKKYLQKELEDADLLWYLIKLTVEFPITIVRTTTSIPSPSSSTDLDLEDSFSVSDEDGFRGWEVIDEKREEERTIPGVAEINVTEATNAAETNTDIAEYAQDSICDIPEEPVETHPVSDEIFGGSVEMEESVLPTLNKEVQQWHEYLAPFMDEIQGQRKKAEVPAAFNRKIVSAFTSENGKTTLPLKDILKSQPTDDYAITFVSMLHMANNKQLRLHVSLPTGRDFLLDECDVTLTKHRLSTASMDQSDSELPEKRQR